MKETISDKVVKRNICIVNEKINKTITTYRLDKMLFLKLELKMQNTLK